MGVKACGICIFFFTNVRRSQSRHLQQRMMGPLQEYTKFSLEELQQQQNKFAHKFAPQISERVQGVQRPPEPLAVPAGFEIMQNLISVRPMPKVLPYRSSHDTPDARRLFCSILEKVEDNITEARRHEFRFGFSHAQGAVIQALVKHAVNDPSGPIPLNKGWYLWGDTQIGKTTIARILDAFHLNLATIRRRSSPKEFVFTDVHRMYGAFHSAEKINLDPFVTRDRLFDDVGCSIEISGVRDYGNQRDPMAEILWQRHQSWLEFGRITYFTSNLPFEGINSKAGFVPGWIDRFDERLRLRLKDMVHPILFPCK
jgi:hypothetical protein